MLMSGNDERRLTAVLPCMKQVPHGVGGVGATSCRQQQQQSLRAASSITQACIFGLGAMKTTPVPAAVCAAFGTHGHACWIDCKITCPETNSANQGLCKVNSKNATACGSDTDAEDAHCNSRLVQVIQLTRVYGIPGSNGCVQCMQ